MKHPKENPQFWANREHLEKVLREQGPEASVAEFRRMQQGQLPPVEKKHEAMALGERRWHKWRSEHSASKAAAAKDHARYSAPEAAHK